MKTTIHKAKKGKTIVARNKHGKPLSRVNVPDVQETHGAEMQHEIEKARTDAAKTIAAGPLHRDRHKVRAGVKKKK